MSMSARWSGSCGASRSGARAAARSRAWSRPCRCAPCSAVADASDIERVADVVAFQAEACAQSGSPLYGRVLDAVVEDLRAGGVSARILGDRGDDPFGSALDTTVAGESIDGKPVATQRLTTLDGLSACRIVFIGDSEQRRVKQILDQLTNAPVLTVSDLPDFADQGGMIQFVRASNRIRFAVNIDATERVGLTLSSELLRVAVAVKSRKARG